MSEPLALSSMPAIETIAGEKPRSMWDRVYTAAAGALLINVHLLAAAGAAIFSIISFVHASIASAAVISGVIGLPVLGLAIKVIMMAWQAEMDTD